MVVLGYATHTHHKPIGLSYPISPSKTCWDTLYLGNGILLMNGFWATGFWDWRDFFRRDFENDGIFSDGILRTTGFFSTGFWERRDFFRRDFEKEWILSDWILSRMDFVRRDFEIEPHFFVIFKHCVQGDTVENSYIYSNIQQESPIISSALSTWLIWRWNVSSGWPKRSRPSPPCAKLIKSLC